jgi:hypothetical protein
MEDKIQGYGEPWYKLNGKLVAAPMLKDHDPTVRHGSGERSGPRSCIKAAVRAVAAGGCRRAEEHTRGEVPIQPECQDGCVVVCECPRQGCYNCSTWGRHGAVVLLVVHLVCQV